MELRYLNNSSGHCARVTDKIIEKSKDAPSQNHYSLNGVLRMQNQYVKITIQKVNTQGTFALSVELSLNRKDWFYFNYTPPPRFTFVNIFTG